MTETAKRISIIVVSGTRERLQMAGDGGLGRGGQRQ